MFVGHFFVRIHVMLGVIPSFNVCAFSCSQLCVLRRCWFCQQLVSFAPRLVHCLYVCSYIALPAGPPKIPGVPLPTATSRCVLSLEFFLRYVCSRHERAMMGVRAFRTSLTVQWDPSDVRCYPLTGYSLQVFRSFPCKKQQGRGGDEKMTDVEALLQLDIDIECPHGQRVYE